MSYELTTALSAGDLGNEDVPELRIVRFTHDSVNQRLTMTVQYGKTVSGEWVRLHPPAGYPSSVVLTGQEYVDFVTANQTTYDTVKSQLYGKLAADGKIPPGTVV